eukprot:6187746-Amphidinium_carterae.1
MVPECSDMYAPMIERMTDAVNKTSSKVNAKRLQREGPTQWSVLPLLQKLGEVTSGKRAQKGPLREFPVPTIQS